VRGITALFTSLSITGGPPETSETLISSLMDTWVLSDLAEVDRLRHRSLYVLKSRGMAHSNEVRDFQITDRGIAIRPEHAATAAGR
jgi:circadian clock protein KaiC